MPYQLTDEEIEWCSSLKAAMLKQELTFAFPMSDLLLAQYAIVSKGDVESALKRMKNYDSAYVENDFGSIEGGDEAVIEWACRRMTGVLCPSGRDICGHPSSTYNVEHWIVDKMVRETEDWKYVLRYMALSMELCCCDLNEIRKGCVIVNAMGNFSWRNFSLEVERRCAFLLQDGYPVRVKGIALVDAPWIVNVALGIIKVFLSRKIASRIFMVTQADLYSSCNAPEEANRSKAFTSRKGTAEFCGPAELPPCLGGTRGENVKQFLLAALQRRREAQSRVKIS